MSKYNVFVLTWAIIRQLGFILAIAGFIALGFIYGFNFEKTNSATIFIDSFIENIVDNNTIIAMLILYIAPLTLPWLSFGLSFAFMFCTKMVQKTVHIPLNIFKKTWFLIFIFPVGTVLVPFIWFFWLSFIITLGYSFPIIPGIIKVTKWKDI